MRSGTLQLALDEPHCDTGRLKLGIGAAVLASFARDRAPELFSVMNEVAAISPFRRMVTQGGRQMSVASTNCGQAGWVSDRTGYRYDPIDPEMGRQWPAIPKLFHDLAVEALARPASKALSQTPS